MNSLFFDSKNILKLCKILGSFFTKDCVSIILEELLPVMQREVVNYG